MCNESHLERWGKMELNRRTFGAGAIAGMAAACAPMEDGAMAAADPQAVSMREVSFQTGEGTLDGEFYTEELGAFDVAERLHATGSIPSTTFAFVSHVDLVDPAAVPMNRLGDLLVDRTNLLPVYDRIRILEK